MKTIAKALSIAKALRRRSRERVTQTWTRTQKKEKMTSLEPRPSGKIVKKNKSVHC